MLKTLLFVALGVSTPLHALGINCRGSLYCKNAINAFGFDNLIGAFDILLSYGLKGFPGGPIDPEHIYYSGQTIACMTTSAWFRGSICVFLQGNVPEAGVNGSIVMTRVHDLYNAACGVCGSVPLSGNNNPDEQGWLTVNYVSSKICNGVCNLVDAQGL
ncbi:hypothetical protein MMC28_002817 [Mycoblastus sanguinarius]|nr:hypothetical protein [Mycoblastus sanguinarius]